MSDKSTVPMINRFAPSPTGFVHIGSIYTALMCERLAHQSGGEFILRIEDTDKKREVDGAIQLIIQGLDHYGIPYDQGPTSEGEKGPHSPYIQSLRGEIYQKYAQQLLDAGHAYYAFDTVEELAALRERQESMGVLRPGYYGDYATWRHRSKEEQIAAKESGLPYVVRLRLRATT
jgi:glutamyl-tRNA synthetase